MKIKCSFPFIIPFIYGIFKLIVLSESLKFCTENINVFKNRRGEDGLKYLKGIVTFVSAYFMQKVKVQLS
jgi:hypothetical protein